MTVGTTISTITIAGNGATTSFDYPFLMPDASDAIVTYTAVGGTQSILAANTYALFGAGSPNGGTVTYPLSGSPIPAGSFLTITRSLPLIQGVSVSNQGPTFAAIEGGLDYLTMLIQQVNGDVSRAIVINPADIELPIPLPPAAERAGQFLAFDSTGQPTVAVAVGGTVIVSAAMQPVLAAGTLVGAAYQMGVTTNFPTIAALRGNGITSLYCYVAGHSTGADGGEGPFWKNAADTTSADNGGTIIVDGIGQRWYREEGGALPSVKWFGATGDGTTDDTVAIQACEDYYGSLGSLSTVQFPAGTYLIGVTGIAKADNVSWRGAGPGASILRIAPGTSLNSLVAAASMTDSDITYLGFDMTDFVTSSQNSMLAISTFTRGQVSNCAFTGMPNVGILISGGSDWSINHCRITKDTPGPQLNVAIWVRNTSSQVVRADISYNILTGSGMDVNAADTTISYNNVTGTAYGAGIATDIDPNCAHLIVTGNICTGGTGIDINLTRPSGIEHWAPFSVVSNNFCEGNAGPGIGAGGLACVYSGNVCFNNGQELTGPHRVGIWIPYVDASTNGGASVITGNRCFDTGGATQLYGLADESSNVGMVTVSGNDFNANSLGPVSLQGVEYDFRGPKLTNQTGGQGGFTLTSLQASPSPIPITVAGAALGDKVTVSINLDLQGLIASGYVSAANTVKYFFFNPTGGSVTIGTFTVELAVEKPLNYANY